MPAEAIFTVGIDLGTTHTVVASAPFAEARSGVEPRLREARAQSLAPDVFTIPQLVSARETAPRPLLPSCLYAPLPGEIDGDPDWVVGELARRRGSEVVGRFVTSAKSWLCHPAVDRLAPILPWGQPEEGTPHISPLDASTRYLAFVREAWDRAHPEALLATQDVILTVPASFDEVARELTVRAATAAGLTVTLVEEPTAAFYDAMRDDEGRERTSVAWDKLLGRIGKKDADAGKEEQFVLVCDVGGGTTDLSLMAVGARKKGEPAPIRRVATGRHILLGGDNMDLALAHAVEARVSGGARLGVAELSQLVLACRTAKERIFGGASDAKVTVLGRGGKLVASAKSAVLTRKEIDEIVVSGFFPRVELDSAPVRTRGGLVSFGLPYERDPAITRHVAAFLTRHAADMGGRGIDAILLNGGVFRAHAIVKTLVSIISSWSGKEPALLPNADPDLAVARGAVLYGFARRGTGIRVESGASRGYYVAVEKSGNQKRAVCILPRGAKEGVFYEGEKRTFELVVGRSVRFDLVASDVLTSEAGEIITIDEPSAADGKGDKGEDAASAFEKLPPLVAHLPAQKKGEETIPVTLGGVLSATGQLELFCTPQGAARADRVRLQFQLRGDAPQASMRPAGASIQPPSLVPAAADGTNTVAPAKLEEAKRIVDKIYGRRPDVDPREVKEIVRDLERVLGDRLSWTISTTRELCDLFLLNPGTRRRTANHERAFYMLCGFCLRPGFGDPKDGERMRVFSTLFDGRLAFPDEPRGWQQFFIAWRRVAGGLDEKTQVAIRDALDPVIAPKEANLKKPRRIPEGQDELCMMLASLERVPVARREELGEWLIARTFVEKDPRLWTAIGRIGARAPLYASVHHVLAPSVVEPWIERLLRENWNELHAAPHAAVQLARVTGDRARDVSEKIRRDVERRLVALHARDEWLRAVREVLVVDEAEKIAMMGEGLPIGLRLPTS